MNTNLYIYKLNLPYDDESTVLFSALAKDEETAKFHILNKVVNEIYKSELKILFVNNI